MKTLRWIIGRLILLFDALTRPKPMQRSAEAQAEVDRETGQMALYQYQACPFCVKVRREMRRLNLNIELRDAKGDMDHRRALKEQGGKAQVPCLRIERSGQDAQWMYESSEINDYLAERFAKH